MCVFFNRLGWNYNFNIAAQILNLARERANFAKYSCIIGYFTHAASIAYPNWKLQFRHSVSEINKEHCGGILEERVPEQGD